MNPVAENPQSQSNKIGKHLAVYIVLALCIAISACGFRLRGATHLPFKTIYTNISDNTSFGASLRRSIVASSPGLVFMPTPDNADVRLTQLALSERRRELTLDAQGHVEEYELNLLFRFQLTDKNGALLLKPTTLTATRDMPYDPDDSQAKNDEMRMIFADMRQSMVDRIVRLIGSDDVIDAYSNGPKEDDTDIYLEDEQFEDDEFEEEYVP